MHVRRRKPAQNLRLGGIRRNACTRSRRLITRRSQVQILPPLLGKALETGPFVRKRADGTTSFVKAEDQLSALSHLDELFGHHGIEYWLFGGWAVDFRAGKVVRPHDDLHLAVWSHDGQRVRELLIAAGTTRRKRVTASTSGTAFVSRSRFWTTANGLRTRSSGTSPRSPGFVRVSLACRR
jgi:hypothetical protein